MEPLPSAELLVVGEALIDLIADEPGVALAEATGFQRVVGGSVTNVAVAFARLGGRAAIATALGDDAAGDFIVNDLRRSGVDTRFICRRPAATSMAFVTRAMDTPEFEILRGADHLLRPEDLPDGLLESARAIHASAFGLSRAPASDAVHRALVVARRRGAITSLDLNYHPAIWPRKTCLPDLARALSETDLVKASDDDLQRLFGEPLDLAAAAARIHDLGPQTVVVTLGAAGAWFSDSGKTGRVAAPEARLVDGTGAGDAFWAGVLRGILLGASLPDAVGLGSIIAGRKIGTVGPLAEDIDPVISLRSLARAGR